MRVLFIYPNVGGFHYDNYHFGLASIVSVTKEAGHDTRVLLITKESDFERVEREVVEFKPEVVGFSSVSSQFSHVKAMCAIIRKVSPKTINVCGGVHTTIYPRSLLETKDLDGVFMGESEFAFREFLENIQKGDYKKTDNFTYVEDGKIVSNPLKPLEQVLDVLPHPDKTTFPYEESSISLNYAPFFFTRGCPYTCTYCSNQALADLYGTKRNFPRFRSPESCIQEIEDVVERWGDRIEWIYIGDDIFGLDLKWRKEFCEKYKERVGIKFMILMRVEMVNDALLTMLKDAGCYRMFFGVESGDEDLRRAVLDRRMTDKQIEDAFVLAKKYGIETLAVNIIGFPDETEEMIKKTVAFNRKFKPTVSGINIFYPYRGTTLGDKCFREDMVDMEKFSNFSNERRDSVLKYSPERLAMIQYYYENWNMLVDPWNMKLRAIWLARKFRIFPQARMAYRFVMAPVRYVRHKVQLAKKGRKRNVGLVRPGPSA